MKPQTQCVVIGLDRRPDRRTAFETDLRRQPHFCTMEWFSAVDGQKLQPTRQLEQLFNPNDYHYRRGIVGCALSHLSIWASLTEQPRRGPLIVLEDDARLVDRFMDRVRHILEQVGTEPWDLIFLGHLPRPGTPVEILGSHESVAVEQWSLDQALRHSIGGTHGYLIHPQGAERLLSYIQRVGMVHAIDTMMLYACAHLRVFFCTRQLVYGNEYLRDSDIQRDFSGIERPIPIRLQAEHEYYHRHGVQTHCNGTLDDTRILFCERCTHPAYPSIDYAIGSVRVHIPHALVAKHPFLANIGLRLDGRWSTKPLIHL